MRTTTIFTFTSAEEGGYVLVRSVCLFVCLLKRLKSRIALNGYSHDRATGRHLPWDHTVLPATRHTWTRPALTPASKLQFTYPGGMEGWVDLGFPAMHRPGVEPAISRPQVQRPNYYTADQPNLSVCPSDNRKSCKWILTKFYGELGCGLETNWLHFGDDPLHYPGPGVSSGTRSGSGTNCHNSMLAFGGGLCSVSTSSL